MEPAPDESPGGSSSRLIFLSLNHSRIITDSTKLFGKILLCPKKCATKAGGTLRPLDRVNDPSETSGGPLASDVVFVGVVDLLDAPVAEGQLPHPVHAAPHARR